MGRATKAEITGRIEELIPLLLDGLRLREIRAYLEAKSAWGAVVSEAQLKRYLAKARRRIAEAAAVDRTREIGAAKLRYERALARAAAKGDMRAYIAANRGLCELFGLPAPTRLEHSGAIDIEAARRTLADEIAQEIADGKTEL
jgi:predicted DNA-binding protein (UPF0251 family)